MDQVIVVEVGYRIPIDLRYEEFSMDDIESAELNSSALIVRLKDSREEHTFPFLHSAICDDHIIDITDSLGQPLPFNVD